ncbi:hypothetical protein PpBr36_02781 [Pyricularia pennisetigena]|uniref:hypothetical protein n=1 Tax=Pyricularia pennisetigena TaxID=1578925 RepID=UPI00115146DF|nr:hypothetical protein PpBr36_02781 [Pyricularia pennisetigena]TLS31233.1 hypothetical protein PpBr36_02781 [Pyricularia pennisetigena]
MSQLKNVYRSAEGQAGYDGSVPQHQHQPVISGRQTCPYEKCVITDPTASRFAVMMLQYFMNIANINTTLDQFDCPVAKCMKQFTEPLEFIKHLMDCPELSKGEFECRKCETWHRFPTTESGWLEFSGWEKTVEKKKRSSFTEKLRVMVRSSSKPSSPRSLRSRSDSCISPSAQSKASPSPSSEFSAGSLYQINDRKESEVQWRYNADAWPTVMPTPEKPLRASTGNPGDQLRQNSSLAQIQSPQEIQKPQELCDTGRMELWDTGCTRSELSDNQLPSSARAPYKPQDSASSYEAQAFWHTMSAPHQYTLGSGTWTSSFEGQLAQHTAHRSIQQNSTDSHDGDNVSIGLLQTRIAPYFDHHLSESPVGLDIGPSDPVTELSGEETSSSHPGSFDSTTWSFDSASTSDNLVASLRTNSSSGSSVGSFKHAGLRDWAPNGEPIFSTFEPQNDGGQAIMRALQEFKGSAPKNLESRPFDLGRRNECHGTLEMGSWPVTNRSAPVAEAPGETEDDGHLTCGHENCDFRPSGTKLHNYRKYLHKHRETHRRARYECDQCPSVYTRSDNLKKHRREKHGIEEARGYGTVRVSSQYRRSPRIAADGQDGLGRMDTLRVSKSPRR